VTANYDVIIVGGGPVGAACARELALAGRSVLVLDPGGEMGQAWRAAAGMLAPQIEAHDDESMLELGLAGRELYPSLATALRETTGLDIGLWREGIAWVAATESEAAELRSTCAWQRQHSHLADWLDAEEVKARWPWIGPTAGAFWAAREGALEPVKLVLALLADAQRMGVDVVQDAVTAIEQRGDRVVGVLVGTPDMPRAMSFSRPGRGQARSKACPGRWLWLRSGGRWRRSRGPRAPAAASSMVKAATC